jgi:hypothetical protein
LRGYLNFKSAQEFLPYLLVIKFAWNKPDGNRKHGGNDEEVTGAAHHRDKVEDKIEGKK